MAHALPHFKQAKINTTPDGYTGFQAPTTWGKARHLSVVGSKSMMCCHQRVYDDNTSREGTATTKKVLCDTLCGTNMRLILHRQTTDVHGMCNDELEQSEALKETIPLRHHKRTPMIRLAYTIGDETSGNISANPHYFKLLVSIT